MKVHLSATFDSETQLICLLVKKNEELMHLGLNLQEAQIFHNILGNAVNDALLHVMEIEAPAPRTH